jgi:glycosyltransferase involved in cell wall biosynthesis
MKIAYLINQYPRPSHSFIRREISALEAIGFSVERISLRSEGPFIEAADIAERQRTRVVLDVGALRLLLRVALVAVRKPVAFLRASLLAARIGRRSDRGLLRNFAYLVEACTVLAWVRRCGAAHVHAHFGTNSAAVAMFTRELGGPPYSFTAHGPEEFERAEFLALDEKIRRADFVVAVSHYGRTQLCRYALERDWKKLVVVRCGLDEGFFRTGVASLPSEGRLVCVARLSEQKGHFVLLDALAQLKASGVEFEMVLVGDGPLRGALEARVRELGLEKRVRFGGWIDEAGVRTAIAASRGLVLTSFAEGLPVVLMEALALGRPVVATEVCGVPELVGADCGWLVPAGSVGHLSAALEALLRAPLAQLAEMGRSGRVRVVDQHDVHSEAAKLALLFRDGPGTARPSVPLTSRSPASAPGPGGSTVQRPAAAAVSALRRDRRQ